MAPAMQAGSLQGWATRPHLLRSLAAVWLIALLAGCAASNRPSQIRPGAVAATCANTVQCTLYWARTREWIARNSARPLNNVTEWMLETASPGTFDASLTFQIVRWPGPNGSGEIRFEAYCSTLMPCSPSKSRAFEDFKSFLAASSQPG